MIKKSETFGVKVKFVGTKKSNYVADKEGVIN
jgi:hypothetical protein